MAECVLGGHAHPLGKWNVLRPANARAEPCGTLLRDNEDEKRYPVSGWNVWLIEPEPMVTSPRSSTIGIVEQCRSGPLRAVGPRCHGVIWGRKKGRCTVAESNYIYSMGGRGGEMLYKPV